MLDVLFSSVIIFWVLLLLYAFIILFFGENQTYKDECRRMKGLKRLKKGHQHYEA